MSSKRISREILNLTKKPIKGVDINFEDRVWIVSIKGKKKTIYEGGNFRLSVEIPPNYPFCPPQVLFITPMYHPNINNKGEICINTLQNWSLSNSIREVLIEICSLLYSPNPDDPLVHEIASLYRDNRERYYEIVKEYIDNYAR